jgi:hypothetical protein
MPASKSKPLTLAAITGGLLLLFAFFTPTGRVPEPLQLTICGATNGPTGSPMAIVSVTNTTGRAQCFYLAAEVATPTGWADAKGWVERQHGLTQRLQAHAACQVEVPAPEGVAKWRLRCASWPEVGKFRWTWYVMVRRTGLSRVGFQDQPSGSYSWTAQVTQ